jgi:hypothetical protein
MIEDEDYMKKFSNKNKEEVNNLGINSDKVKNYMVRYNIV